MIKTIIGKSIGKLLTAIHRNLIAIMDTLIAIIGY